MPPRSADDQTPSKASPPLPPSLPWGGNIQALALCRHSEPPIGLRSALCRSLQHVPSAKAPLLPFALGLPFVQPVAPPPPRPPT